MSRVDLFNGVEITIEGTATKYHSYTDWGLYVTNTDYIKEPKQNTNYVSIPGRDGLLDLSDVITGRPTYSGREISLHIRPLILFLKAEITLSQLTLLRWPDN